MLSVGVQPNLITFNTLIDACGRAHNLEKAFQVFKLVRQCHWSPDANTYAAMIDLCAKVGEVDAALELLMQVQHVAARVRCSTLRLGWRGDG